MNTFKSIKTIPEPEPKPDLCGCCTCGNTYSIAVLRREDEGDYENGYYTVYICPKCEDGGCICGLHMSKRQANKWNAWKKENA